jgi:O-antigen ligase
MGDHKSRLGVLLLGLLALAAVAIAAVAIPYVALTIAALRRPFSLVEFFASIAAGPRLALWSAAWSMFLQDPLWGVGLGQFGFHFGSHVPVWSVEQPDVSRFLFSGMVPNPKSMVFRLLAEGGVLALVVFMTFVTVHFRRSRRGEGLPRASLRRWQLSPHLVLLLATAIAVVADFSTLDTFALPQLWACLALVHAEGAPQHAASASWQVHREGSRLPDHPEPAEPH